MEGQQRSHQGERQFPWLRAIIALLVSMLVSAAAILLILSTEHVIAAYWLVIIPIALAAIGQLIPLYQYLFPISTDTKPDLPLSPPTPVEVKVTLTPPAAEPSRDAQTKQLKAPKLLWNVPYRRNPYFTGRQHILQTLHERLTAHQPTALTQVQSQAISGLGGIGKTQIAIEYAYRHRKEYQGVLWVNAASRETIIASFLELADLLELPERQEADQNTIVTAMRRWLTIHDHWLLIFDNADDLTLAEEFLPTSATGSLLFTTRNQSVGTLAESLDIQTMNKEEGTLLVLRRAKLLAREQGLEQARPEERTQAELIVKEMDGLPLAIDQAAAYIEETHSSLASYLKAYQRRHGALLAERGNDLYKHLPVATTWLLNFEQVEQGDRTASDLLHVLALLAPDAIPEDLLIAGARELGSALEGISEDETLLNQVIGSLLRFSLVQRSHDLHLLSIHRLVQEIIRSRMPDETRRAWAERTVRAMNKAFPDVNFSTWPQCERYLPHALASVALIEYLPREFPEAARLLNKIAAYLRQRAQYSDSPPKGGTTPQDSHVSGTPPSMKKSFFRRGDTLQQSTSMSRRKATFILFGGYTIMWGMLFGIILYAIGKLPSQVLVFASAIEGLSIIGAGVSGFFFGQPGEKEKKWLTRNIQNIWHRAHHIRAAAAGPIAAIIILVIPSLLVNQIVVNPPVNTETPTTFQGWHTLLRQVAPDCNNPQGVEWYVHSKGTSLSCSGSGLAMQQISNYFPEVDLVQVNGGFYSQTTFRVQVQATFQNPHDTMNMAAVLVQSPAAVNAVGGYLFVLSPTGQWYLQNATATGEIQIVTTGSISINSSQPATITVEVRNNMLQGFINNRPVVSYTDNLNPSPGQVGLLVTVPSTSVRASVFYSNFELDG